jgi:hypothetical protein
LRSKFLVTFRYDESLKKWVYVRPMNNARCTLSAVSSADFRFIYVLGGFDGQALNVVERYSVMEDQWEFLPPM